MLVFQQIARVFRCVPGSSRDFQEGSGTFHGVSKVFFLLVFNGFQEHSKKFQGCSRSFRELQWVSGAFKGIKGVFLDIT